MSNIAGMTVSIILEMRLVKENIKSSISLFSFKERNAIGLD